MMLPHCKNPAHLRVTVTPSGPEMQVTATYAPVMQCENHVQSPGVVLSHRHGHPLDGMHLLPDAIAWLPGQLRDHARAAGPTDKVTISHTSRQQFVDFASLTRPGALALADAIEAAHP